MSEPNFIAPFITYYRSNNDYNSDDAEQEFKAMLLRNNAIEDCLNGGQSEDYLFDLLAEQGIEPSIYLNTVESEVSYFLANPHLLYS